MSCDDPRVAWLRTKTQLGTLVGLGVRRRFSGSHLDLQLLGDFSLTDLNRDPLPLGYTKLLTISLTVTYVVHPGGRAR